MSVVHGTPVTRVALITPLQYSMYLGHLWYLTLVGMLYCVGGQWLLVTNGLLRYQSELYLLTDSKQYTHGQNLLELISTFVLLKFSCFRFT